jgi:HAD superfamily hydrolase (TIGR01549 family)
MTSKRHIRCLLFDLGSTLWTREEQGNSLAKERACTLAGSILRDANGDELFPELDDCALGLLLQKTVSRQIRQEKRLHPGYEPNFMLATLHALRELGVANADCALAAALFEALRIRIPVSRALFADTLSTLSALKQRGYTLGVVTNRDHGGTFFREDLQTMGLLDYFEYRHMAISADLGIRKPHPDIFWYALNGLHALPEETAMVGDSLEADMVGAQKLNMLSIWRPKPAVLEESKQIQPAITPDVTIEHLSELLEIF